MIQVVPVVTGSLKREGRKVVEAHSSSTLVISPDAIILVDTSSIERRTMLLDGLERAGIRPSQVDMVVLTHLHHDHIGNLDLFPKARRLARVEEDSTVSIEQVLEDMELSPGVFLMHTPGHTLGSMSVVVRAADAIYVIAGDAIPTRDNHERRVPPGININSQLALTSMERIRHAGDIIVPGHGEPFISCDRR